MGRTKPALRRFASGWADSAAPFIILAVPVLLGLSGFLNQGQGASAATVWTEVGVRAVAFFAISAPLVLLGIYAVSKIFKFQLTGGTYIRAAAIAAVPMIAILGASLLSTNTGLKTVALLIAIPLAALLAGTFFELKPVEMLAAAGICIPLLLVGIGLSNKASTLAANSSDDITALAKSAGVGGTSSTPAPGGAGQRGAARSGPSDPMQARLNDLVARVEETGADAMARMTREQFDERIKGFQTELESLRSAKGTTPQWERLSSQLRELAPKGQSLPSEKPDDSLFQPMATSQNWSSIALDAQGGAEISFDTFNLRLPQTARLDLRISDPSALSWSWPNSWTTMALKMVAAPDTRQKRPWIVNRAMLDRLTPAPKFYVIEADPSAMTAGNLADTVFFRIDRSATSHADILYTALVDGKWLTATITRASASEARAAFEAAVKSLRKRPSTEAKADPFAPAMLVRRLEDDPDAAVPLLRKQGAASENALLAVVKDGNPRVQARALAILSEVGTSKSVEVLRPLLDSSDKAVSQGAMTVLKRVAPMDYDDLAMAAMLLKRGNDIEKRASLQTLATAQKDPARPQITRELDAFMLLENRELYDESVKALSVWADSQTATLFLPWLAEGTSVQRRNAAFAILPTTKDPLVVLPMLRWTVREPEAVVKALVTVGPVAEDEVIRQLFTNLENNRNPEARKAGARILQEIGSSKSLPVLQRASNDPRDANAAQVAKVALEVLRQRVQPARGGPTTRGRG